MAEFGFGVDITPAGEVLAQVERLPEGRTHFTLVFLEPEGNTTNE